MKKNMRAVMHDSMKNKEYVLSAPFSFEGEPERVSLSLDFDKLTGGDLIEVQEDMAALGYSINTLAELDKRYQTFVAARVSGVSPEFIMALPVKDFSAITVMAQNFLFGMG